ncbi:MAG TPA: cytochrome B6 [Cyanothece sp. UBA12306]|nr:cytochrome B6 [Cyanothece sp. UBA12306]
MEIGQKVKVYRLRDRVSKDIAGKLGQQGIIKDYKMTDGSGIGAVVKFNDQTAVWFFEDELKLVE